MANVLILAICDRNNLYGCPPPSCRTNTDCNGLECRNGLCVDEFPQRKAAGSACDKHSDCLPSTLCANNKCVTTQRVGSFAICDKDQDCLQGSTGSSKETCAKYKTTDQKSGVCLLPTSDPNLIVTPIPYSTTRSYNMTTTRGIGYNRGRNCELHRELCGNNMYQQLMKDNCPETCRNAGYNLNCINRHPKYKKLKKILLILLKIILKVVSFGQLTAIAIICFTRNRQGVIRVD
uniref:ShKT domain-containing protein n=1 Tax=Meloidogyne enterolobii TaxID=390850 RepID=A0A6V7UJ26_MELEN|nr:unnamed protein product [Meloidogyne enterolobii]